MKKKKIIFVVPDGTGIRNYLFSELISYLLKSNTELLIYHVLSKDAITEVEQLHNIKLTTKQLPKYSETLQQKFLRESICYARLLFYVKLEDNPTLRKRIQVKRSGFIN